MKTSSVLVLFTLPLVLWVLLAPGCASVTPGPAEAPAQPPPEEGKVAFVEERDLVYATPAGQELRLDLIHPDDPGRRLPLVIFIYGSEHAYHSANRVNFAPAAAEAARRGYVAANIAYRTTYEKVDGKPLHEFPSQVHDAKCAVRWLRANAGRYGIDPDRVGLVGYSSGANLALMAGLTDPSDGLEGECGDPAVSSRVQAIVNLAGETDAVEHYRIAYTYYRPLLGGSPDTVPERYRQASPLTYVSPDDPPVLTIVGGEDARLPQAQLLDERLRGVGASHTLIVVPGASHYMNKIVDFAQDGPVWEFLDRHLRGGG